MVLIFLQECGFLEKDFISLYKECKNVLIDRNEEYLYYIKNRDEALIERFLNK